MQTNVKHPLRLLRLTLCGLCLAWWAGPLQAQQAIRAFTAADWQQLKQQAEQSPPLPTQPLAAYFSAGHFFPALPLQPLLSADGHWVYYWRRQGQQYWLCRSQGDGEEQVLHKQREVPPPQLMLSRDQQQLWLAASDLLQVLDIRRKTLQTIWQPGFALPGSRQSLSRHSAQLIELNADGAVLQWQQASTSYWFLNNNHAARQIWPTPQRSGWQNSAGKVLFMQHAQVQESAQAAETTSGLLPDISAQLRSADGKLLATARLYQRLYWQSEDPAWQTLLDQLQALWPLCSMQLQSAALVTQKSAAPDKVKSAAFKLLVSYFCSDQTAAQLLLLTLDIDLQIHQRQWLQLSATAPLPAGVSPQQVAWQANDGHTIPGHLYLPPGRPLAQSPLVTLIHGGPFSRTDPSYDVLVQWLVNHGAIVLQVDYRSSAGYGPAFMQAAQGNFGPDNLLLGDIFSGLDLLLQNGIGNLAQQAVIGHSFGGYLTIQALQAQPQRFRFGLALAAPVDLAATLQAYVPTAATPFGEKTLSDLLNDAAVPWQDPHWQRQLSAASPRARITLLQRPLYLWAGGRDDRIPAATLQQFQQQALAQHKTVRLWLDPDSGHQTSTLQGRRLQFYLAASLLVSHLQSGPQPSFAPAAHNDSGNPQLDPLDDMLQTLEVRPATTGN